MTDLATLVLAIDSTQVGKGAAALDNLTASGKRAEGTAAAVTASFNSAGAAASRMATQAQASATSAVGLATGMKSAGMMANNARVAMLDMTHVGINLTTMLASGVNPMRALVMESGRLATAVQYSSGGIGGLIRQTAEWIGILKVTRDAELAEEAANAASAATAVSSAAQRAASAIAAADTELALAQASVRVATTSQAETAAQARVAAAHEAVAAAAAEATVAEDALAVAQGRAATTAAASAAKTVVGISALGTALGLAAIAGGSLAVAFAAAKDSAEQADPAAKNFIATLGLTHKEIERLKDVTVTWGDVAHGTFNAIAEAAGISASQFKSFWREAFLQTAQVGISVAQVLVAAFAAVKDVASSVGPLPRVPHPIDAAKKAFADTGEFFHGILPDAINKARDDRLQKQADKLIADRTPKKPKKESDHGLQDALDKLDAEIKGQYALAAAYGVSDAAVQRAIARQKAEEDAISHKANAQQTELFYQKELQKAVATDVAAAAGHNTALQFDLSQRARLNAQIAAGTITVAQANDQLKIETRLRSLNADLENADAAHKQKIRDLIKDTIDLETEDLQLKAQINALTQIASNDNDIERLRLEASLLGASNKERAVALAQLEAMQKLKAIDPNGLLTRGERSNFVQSEIDKATASVRSPFQDWAATIPQTADAITRALQGIEFRGFDSLASAITDVVTGTKSLGQAFKDVAHSIIADLVQMTIRMLIFRAISGALGGGGGTVTPNPNAGGLTVPGAFAKGGVFSGGNVIPFASGGVVGGPTLFPMSGGRTGLMGENGEEAVMPLARDPSGRLGVRAANSNTPQHVIVEVRLDSGMLQAEIIQGAGQVFIAGAPELVKAATKNTLRVTQRRPLSGGRG